MVLAERNSEIVRNGRRSRGPSPNGHAVTATVTPETSSDDDNSIKRNGKTKNKQSEYEEKIRVGRDYQAVCPPYIPETERKLEVINDRALLVWSPTIEIPESKLEDYISVAKERYGYNGEQALGMLFWHKHDLERAVMDLANFTPFPDEWTTEDKTLFDQAFSFHGKSFHRIRQMLPDKSIASLVKYYYSWKKSRTRSSVLDRQEKIKANKDSSDNGSENGSNEDSENEDKIQQHKQQICSLKRKNSESSEELRQIESSNRVNSRWTNDELLLAVHGVRKFGKDFQSIAETIGTKTEAHVRTFYVNYRRRYSLDQVLKEHEAEKEAVKQEEQKKKTNDVNETDDNKDLHIETVILGNDDDDDTNGISTSNCIKFQEDNVRSKTASPNPNDGIISIDIDNETSERPLIKKINLPTSTAATTTV